MKFPFHRAIMLALVASACRQARKGDAGDAGEHMMESTVRKSVPIGIDSHLQLLEDRRIDSVLRSGFQRGLPDDSCAEPGTEQWKMFCRDLLKRPLLPARLLIVDKEGTVRGSVDLERPIADLVTIDSLTPGHRWYGISVDMTAEMGSYSGPFLRLLDSRRMSVSWEQATDERGERKDIVLPTTLKTAWQIAAGGNNSAREILLVTCRPDLRPQAAGDTAAFVITYSRFAFTDASWQERSRTASGIWENDGDFPQRNLFPK